MALPDILVASPIRDAAKWLTRFLDNFERVDYPKNRLHYAFLVGESKDDTYEILVRFQSSHENVWLKRQKKLDWRLNRFQRLAISRNILVDEARKDESYILMIDSDVVEFPASMLRTLLQNDVDIVAPLVIIEDTEQFYDTHAFIYKKSNFYHLKPYAPPLQADEENPFEVDSVGTCYLVKRRVYDAEIRYCSDKSEQRCFCFAASKNNFKIWVDPRVTIKHANFKSYEEGWH